MANVLPLLSFMPDFATMRGQAAAGLTPLAHTPPPMEFSMLSPDKMTMDAARAQIGQQPPRYDPTPGRFINQPINPPPLPWFAYAGGQALPPNDRIPAPPQRPGMAPGTNVTAQSQLPQGSFTPQPMPAQVTPDEQVGNAGQQRPPQFGIQPQSGFEPDGLSRVAQQAQQPQQSPFTSDAGLMGLLAAGLGILANNTGHYGQAGPAIGKGGMMGLQTFLGERQQGIENQRRQQAIDAEERNRRDQLSINERLASLQERKDERETSAIERRNKALARFKPESEAEAFMLEFATDDYVKMKLKGAENFKLGQGDAMYGPDGKLIVKNPKDDVPDGMQRGPDGKLGWIPGFLEGKSKVAKAGASQVNVNTEVEKAGRIELAKLDAKRVEELRAAGDAARRLGPVLKRMEQASANDSTYTGKFADWAVDLGNIAVSLNLADANTIKKVGLSEQYVADLAELVRNKIKAMGSGSGISNIDLLFTNKSMPELLKTKEGRLQIIQAMRTDMENIMLDANAADTHFRDNDGSLRGFEHPSVKNPIRRYDPATGTIK
jgi:hypothetical protein